VCRNADALVHAMNFRKFFVIHAHGQIVVGVFGNLLKVFRIGAAD
jgi:hypothetical protein